jgi:energy-coupling factor transport system ATP-binding protein
MVPQVLLMDEPTASLDPARRGELAAILRQLADGGCALLLASHDEEFVRGCAHRVLTIAEGRINAVSE